MTDRAEQEDEIYLHPKLKLANNLASPDRNKRERAMSLVCLWLTSQREVKEEELFKIWKGLFYCLRRAEKVPSQQEDLVCRMSNLIEKLDSDLSLMFFKAFLTATVKELETIEDECSSGTFYVLLSHNVSRVLSILKINGWNLTMIQSFMDAILERSLLVQDGLVMEKINKQIADVFLGLLKEFLPIPIEVLPVLLDPFWIAMEKGGNKSVSEKIITRIFIPICESGIRRMEDRSIDSEDGYLGDCVVSLPLLLLSSRVEKIAAISESHSLIVKELQEKAMHLENLMNLKKVEVKSNQSNSTDTACILEDCVKSNQSKSTDTAGILEDCVEATVECTAESPRQLFTFKTFGRRTKRNQNISFSMQTQDGLENIQCYSSSQESFEVGEASTEEIHVPIHGEVTARKLEDETTAFINNDVLNCGGNVVLENSVILNLAEKFDSIGDDGSCFESFVSDSTCFESFISDSTSFMSFPSPTATSTPLAPSPVNTGSRKRKNWIFSPMDFGGAESPTGAKENNTLSPNNNNNNNNSVRNKDDDDDGSPLMAETLSMKKSRKVHFSLQHNIVWKPSTPLPPHDLRVPPAATPRGSALKKGVPPGPVLVLDESVLVSPKRRKKKNTPKKTSSLKSAKSPKRSTKKGYSSPR